jgi:hypothetical protein
MSEDLKVRDPGAVWRNQPAEQRPVTTEQFMNRRTRELHSSTRTEILLSISAALFFVAVICWQLTSVGVRIPRLELGAVIVWILISLYWFRGWIWRAEPKDAFAATGLAYYRKELERRRDHLRNAWIWHGPLLLACLTLAAVWIGEAFPGFRRWRNVAPPIVLLAAWTAFSIWRRRIQANELQKEIDELVPARDQSIRS